MKSRVFDVSATKPSHSALASQDPQGFRGGGRAG